MSTLTVTTIQPDLQWEDKSANLRRLEEKIDGIAVHTELVILPEMFSTGFSMRPDLLAERMDGPTVDWMRTIAARKKIILTGSVIIEEERKYFNRLVWMLPNGQYGYYDKRHRFAYAGENEHYSAGHKRLIASVKGWKILLLVCYDLRFPVWSRQAPQERTDAPGPAAATPGPAAAPGEANPRTELPLRASPELRSSGISAAPSRVLFRELEYDLIIYVANWPQRRSHAWKTLLQARAIENQAYVIGVNRVGNDGNDIAHSGDSMIIDPLGEVLYHGVGNEEVFTLTLEKEKLDAIRERFPFWKDADRFHIDP